MTLDIYHAWRYGWDRPEIGILLGRYSIEIRLIYVDIALIWDDSWDKTK